MASSPVHPPSTPADVLTFWFGDEWLSNRAALSTAEYGSEALMRRWFGASKEMDAECTQFTALIRAAGKCELSWPDSIDATLARVILLDQLTRGAFRGSPEAFAYDMVAVKETVGAVERKSHEGLQTYEHQFLFLPLMHSEDAAHQELSVKLFGVLAEQSGIPALAYQLKMAVEHAEVVRRFGRFPHRNAANERETTAEEAAWLAGPDVPAWARSQNARKTE